MIAYLFILNIFAIILIVLYLLRILDYDNEYLYYYGKPIIELFELKDNSELSAKELCTTENLLKNPLNMTSNMALCIDYLNEEGRTNEADMLQQNITMIEQNKEMSNNVNGLNNTLGQFIEPINNISAKFSDFVDGNNKQQAQGKFKGKVNNLYAIYKCSLNNHDDLNKDEKNECPDGKRCYKNSNNMIQPCLDDCRSSKSCDRSINIDEELYKSMVKNKADCTDVLQDDGLCKDNFLDWLKNKYVKMKYINFK